MWWIAAIASAAANQTGYLQNVVRETNEIKRQKRAAQEAYEAEREYKDGMFRIQRGEALDALGIQKNRLAEAFGADVSGFNLGLEGQALQNQSARVSLAEGAGAALAAQGAGGTRGSDSLQQQINFHETQFARQEDFQNRGNALAMQNMSRSYTNQFDDIGREVDSWNPGGYNYRAKALSDVYAEKLHGLNMDEYNNAYDDAGFNFMDFMLAGLNGAQTGAQFGRQIKDWRKQEDLRKQEGSSDADLVELSKKIRVR